MRVCDATRKEPIWHENIQKRRYMCVNMSINKSIYMQINIHIHMFPYVSLTFRSIPQFWFETADHDFGVDVEF